MPSIQELVPAFKNHAKSMGIHIRGSDLQSALATFIDFTLTVPIKSALPADADGSTLLFKSGIETNLPDNYNELHTNGKWTPDEEADCNPGQSCESDDSSPCPRIDTLLQFFICKRQKKPGEDIMENFLEIINQSW